MTPVSNQPRPIPDGAVNTFLLNEQSLLDSLAGEAARRGIIIVGGKALDARAALLDGRLDLSRVKSNLPDKAASFDTRTLQTQSAGNTLGDPQLDGLVNEIVKTNGDIDSLLADYQKAVNGELKDANGNKIDPFIIQTKLQQAMQRRLELVTLLSNIMKMAHDTIMAIINNLR